MKTAAWVISIAASRWRVARRIDAGAESVGADAAPVAVVADLTGTHWHLVSADQGRWHRTRRPAA